MFQPVGLEILGLTQDKLWPELLPVARLCQEQAGCRMLQWRKSHAGAFTAPFAAVR